MADTMTPPPSSGTAGMLSGSIPDLLAGLQIEFDRAVHALWGLFEDAGQAGQRLGQAGRLLTGDGRLGSVERVLWALVLLLAASAGIAGLVYLVLRSRRRILDAAAPSSAMTTGWYLLRCILVDSAPALVFAAVASGGGVWLFWDRGLIFAGTEPFRAIVSMVVTTITIAWLLASLVGVPLAVERPGLRILPIETGLARAVRRFLRQIITLGAVAWTAASTLYLVWIGEGLPRLIMISTALVICVLCLRALSRLGHRLTGYLRVWRWLAMLGVLGIADVWVIALGSLQDPPANALVATFAVIALVPALDGIGAVVIARLVRHLIAGGHAIRRIFIPAPDRDDGDGEALASAVAIPAAGEEAAIATEMLREGTALGAVLQEILRWALTIAAAAALAKTWAIDWMLLGDAAVPEWLTRIAEAALTVLIGWYVWRLFETSLALRLSREEGGHQSRAETVQPLLRSIGRLVIAAIALMSALSTLGLNIAPLLASAGIVGIAVGFGAQTLVRDLFSGACYLIEDVFRIGDYIEGGGAKGKVERITFRTVALRHQNGPLHFVPYGSLGAVRNNSRDWVIDKFEIPLAITAQSEQVRKMIKAIGQAMQNDPQWAPLLVMPLKAKLHRIEPGAKIFRCKFQTYPERQFEIRTEAYRRIETALAEAGISYADHTPNVTLNGPDPATVRVAAAA